MELLRNAALGLADLVVPRTCPCGREGVVLCSDCRSALEVRPRRVEAACPALQRLAAADAARGEEALVFEPVLPVLALGEHREGLRQIVLAWKNGGMLCLVRPLAAALAPGVRELLDHRTARAARAVSGSGWDPEAERAIGGRRAARRGRGPADGVLLVPVPSSPARRLRRGEDHTAELAREIGRLVGHPSARMLALRGPSQRGLDRQQRRARGGGSVRVIHAADRDRPVILVDDVVTTGTTLASARDALRGSGVEVIGALVVGSARLPCAMRVPANGSRATNLDAE